MKIAIFDMGSNSIRFMIGALENGTWLNSPKQIWTTRLGKRNEEGQLTEEAMAKTCKAIEEGLRLAQEAQCSDYICLATSAVREAPNGKDFAAHVEATYGVPVSIISGEEEGQYGFIGATADFLCEGHTCAIIDVGGASTEVALGSCQAITNVTSYPVGAVRLKAISDEGVQRVWEETKWLWNPITMDDTFSGFIGIGGTFTTLAAIDLELDFYDSKKVHGHRLSRETVEGLALRLRYMDEEELAQVKGLSLGRRDIIVAGTEIIASIMDAYDIGSLIVSEKDGMEGWQIAYLKK